METLHRRCAGLDVHQKEIVACRRLVSGRKSGSELGRFPTTTPRLLALSAWLREAKVTHVAMEATGVYWKPVCHVLRHDFKLILANAAHIRNVPVRKSDANDATWIADLLAHGLIRASFAPPQPIQELRDLTRTRRELTREIVRHTQRIQARRPAAPNAAYRCSDVDHQARQARLENTRLGRRPPCAQAFQGRLRGTRRPGSSGHCCQRAASIKRLLQR
ncbi:transposase [Rhodoblastus acidophilus]|nr:transposase [Rhodoblastus acidophilus]